MAIILGGGAVAIRQLRPVVTAFGRGFAQGVADGVAGRTPQPAGSSAGATSPSVGAAPPDATTVYPAVVPPGTPVVAVFLPSADEVGELGREAWDALTYYLDRFGRTPPVQLRRYDTHDDQDAARCEQQARLSLGHRAEVAALGSIGELCTYALAIELNRPGAQAPLLVTGGSTTGALTVDRPGTGLPDQFRPSHQHTVARIIATDAQEAAAVADHVLKVVHAKRCAVLEDYSAESAIMTEAFRSRARKIGLTVPWVATRADDEAGLRRQFEQIKRLKANCLYLSGVDSHRVEQVLTVKRAVLGDQHRTPVVMSAYQAAEFDWEKPSVATGVWVANQLVWPYDDLPTPVAEEFMADYDLANIDQANWPSSLLNVAALQVIIKGIQQSDHSRAGIRRAVLNGREFVLPARTSMLGELRLDGRTGDAVHPRIQFITLDSASDSKVSTRLAP